MQAPFIPAIVGSGAVRTALSISFSGTKNARADEASIARNAETSMPAEKARFPDPVKTMALTILSSLRPPHTAGSRCSPQGEAHLPSAPVRL